MTSRTPSHRLLALDNSKSLGPAVLQFPAAPYYTSTSARWISVTHEGRISSQARVVKIASEYREPTITRTSMNTAQVQTSIGIRRRRSLAEVNTAACP
jgi:hypothetical protein